MSLAAAINSRPSKEVLPGFRERERVRIGMKNDYCFSLPLANTSIMDFGPVNNLEISFHFVTLNFHSMAHLMNFPSRN